ncbi:T9SS type A sorting domain-containing protein [bacterium]|nr:T9SS type A sorting domain-containing protein [bacterium]
MDWCNPHTGWAIPGSSLQRTPVAINRENNSKNIVITSPPCYTHTLDFLIDIQGVCENELINEVQVNGKFYPVVDGSFNAEEIYLPNYQNIVTAKVSVGDTDYTYAIEVFRDDPIMPITQFVDLPAGYTGISSYVIPDYTSVFYLFEFIQDHFIFLRNFNQFYIPQMGINTIENWDTHSGYIARMSVHDSVEFYGLEVRNKTVEFNMEHNGWNLLPVLSTNDFYRGILTDSLGSSFDIIKEIGGEELWWSGFEGNLYLLRKDKTYFIKVNEACSFTFWDYNYITDKQVKEKKTIEYPWNDVIKTGFSHLIAFNNSDLQSISGTMQGDPIGAFTPDGFCVGIAAYDTALNYTILTAFADDELSESEIEGFIAGEEMYFRLYQEGNNKEFHLIVQYNQQFPNADGKYAVNGVSVISEVSAEPFSINELLFDNYAQVYPNPNPGVFNIKLKNDDTIDHIRIRDLHGKEVDFSELSMNNEQHQIKISVPSQGIFFLELSINKNIIIKKIIVY